MSERDIWISFQAGNPKVKVLDGRLKISSKTAINKIAISGISGLDDLNKICQNLSRNIKSLHNVQVLTEKHKKDSILLLLFIPTEDTSSVVKMLCSFKESDWKETNIVFNKVEVIECLRSSVFIFRLYFVKQT
ncbi:hypothetical protein MHBO_005191 [Bonamia ostreae]|uniref:LAGLIDADG homing endonuclease n=1 Tax=Bonamia ostreae TaxID=126728 RepID=A0ABV2AV99_9EUKA